MPEVVGALRADPRLDRLDEPDVVPEPAEPEQELKDRPGGPALVRVAGQHAAKEDRAGHGLRPDADLLQEPAEHLVRVEIVLGDPASRPAVRVVVADDLLGPGG